MSTPQVIAFIEKLSTDSAFRDEVYSAISSAQITKIATAAGFDFTIDEFRAVAATIPTETTDRLADEEMEDIGGGISGFGAGMVSPGNGVKLSPGAEVEISRIMNLLGMAAGMGKLP
jgi:predicted ribosomally synthesized peptide with nif11-like leader